jgi:hypothetical protein
LLFGALLCGSICSEAAEYRVYDCGKKHVGSASQCLQCAEDKDVTAELAIDTGKASVTTKYKVKLEDESRRESVVQHYASCKIFDKKNWDCSESRSLLSGSTRNEFRMSEGIIIFGFETTY